MDKEKRDDSIILKVENLSKEFSGVKVLNNIRFDLKRGEVHALIGENGAGKSTFMNILLGVFPANGGEIYFKNSKVEFDSPHEALKAGISMIHQEISLMNNMSVSENVWIGREQLFKKNGLIDKKEMAGKTNELLSDLGINLDPFMRVGELSLANMQMVELVRAVSYGSEIIIMDEPTSALTQTEVEILYKVVRDLSSKGTAIIFISHKLNEIFDICDRVTVMRDGCYIATHDCREIDMNNLIRLIVGRELTQIYPERGGRNRIGDVVLEAEHISGGAYKDVSFKVRSGEIVGFCGLMGAGRTEIMRGLFGVDRNNSGTVRINQQEVTIRSPIDAIRYGIGMVTEDRLHLGGIKMLSIKDNITIVKLKELLKARFFIRKRAEGQQAADMVKRLNIKTSSMSQLLGNLSGGNQQKVVLGKWLMINPKVLILDEPTRGIDVGSKYEIYTQIIELAKQGMAILMVSSELPEILGMSDRVYVVRQGQIVAEHENENLTQEMLVAEEFGA